MNKNEGKDFFTEFRESLIDSGYRCIFEVPEVDFYKHLKGDVVIGVRKDKETDKTDVTFSINASEVLRRPVGKPIGVIYSGTPEGRLIEAYRSDDLEKEGLSIDKIEEKFLIPMRTRIKQGEIKFREIETKK